LLDSVENSRNLSTIESGWRALLNSNGLAFLKVSYLKQRGNIK
jgi:hypothetical protein